MTGTQYKSIFTIPKNLIMILKYARKTVHQIKQTMTNNPIPAFMSAATIPSSSVLSQAVRCSDGSALRRHTIVLELLNMTQIPIKHLTYCYSIFKLNSLSLIWMIFDNLNIILGEISKCRM